MVVSAEVRKLFDDFSAQHLSNDRAWHVENSQVFSREEYEKVLAGITQCGQDEITGAPWYDAPTPWHAAIFLMDKQARQGFITPPASAYDPRMDFQSTAFKLVFRGQNARYGDIRPTAWRLPDGERKQNETKLGVFCFLLKAVTEQSVGDVISLQAHVYQAAAQQYGIPTALLDWTTDPSIAIHFAQDRPAPGDTHGRVYFANYEWHPQLRVLIPPPFVVTLFRERGFFHYPGGGSIENQRTLNDKFFHACSRIDFPLDHAFQAQHLDIFTPNKRHKITDELLIDLVENVEEIAPNVDQRFFEDLHSKYPHIQQGGLMCLKQVLDPVAKQLAKEHIFDADAWLELRAFWFQEIVRFVNELFAFRSSKGDFIANDSLIEAIPFNRDAIFLYCARMLQYIDETGDNKKHPHLEKVIKAMCKEHPEFMRELRTPRRRQ